MSTLFKVSLCGLLSQSSQKGPKPWPSGPQDRLGSPRNRELDWEPHREIDPAERDWQEASFADEQTEGGASIALQITTRERSQWEALGEQAPATSSLSPSGLRPGHRDPVFLLGTVPSSYLHTVAAPFSLPRQVLLTCQLWTLSLTLPQDAPSTCKTRSGPPLLRPRSASQGCDPQRSWLLPELMPSSPRDLVRLTHAVISATHSARHTVGAQ